MFIYIFAHIFMLFLFKVSSVLLYCITSDLFEGMCR